MKDRKWLQDVTFLTRSLTLATFSTENTCIATSRILIEVLARSGVAARPVPVVVKVENEKARALTEQRVPVEQWPDDAWSVAIDVQQEDEPRHWNGHLCVMVKGEGFGQPRVFIDPTADQFSRPERNLIVGGPILFGVGKHQLFTPQDPLGTVLNRDQPGSMVTAMYWPMPPQLRQAKTFLNAPNWNMDPALLDECVEKILAEVGR